MANEVPRLRSQAEVEAAWRVVGALAASGQLAALPVADEVAMLTTAATLCWVLGLGDERNPVARQLDALMLAVAGPERN